MADETTGDDLTRRATVGSAALTLGVSALVLAVSATGITVLCVVVLLAMLAFITAVWAIFWARVNRAIPKMAPLVVAMLPRLGGTLVPLLVVLLVLVAGDAADRFGIVGPTKSELTHNLQSERQFADHLHGEADYRFNLIQGKGGLRLQIRDLRESIEGPQGYKNQIQTLEAKLRQKLQVDIKSEPSAPHPGITGINMGHATLNNSSIHDNRFFDCRNSNCPSVGTLNQFYQGNPQRFLTDEGKKWLLQQIPATTNKIYIRSQAGDDEGERFAETIREFLNSSGFNIGPIDNTNIFNPPRKGLTINPASDQSVIIFVGVHP